jgi:hypothetical protein
MDSRRAKSLLAAERVRDISLGDAKRALAENVARSNANRRAAESLALQTKELERREIELLKPGVRLNVGYLEATRRYKKWLEVQLKAGEKAVENAERVESDSRAMLGQCWRARDTVRRLRERRFKELLAEAARRAQHALDDQGAIRAALTGLSANIDKGDLHGD